MEAKQADFLRCIWTFRKMADVWQTLSTGGPGYCGEPGEMGRIAYAKQKSAMFREMERQVKFLLILFLRKIPYSGALR